MQCLVIFIAQHLILSAIASYIYIWKGSLDFKFWLSLLEVIVDLKFVAN